MSTLNTAMAGNGYSPARGNLRIFGRISAAVRRWSVLWTERRLERAAITVLHRMSDRQLRDIGISRSEIEFAVTSGTGERRPV